jgi:hypothetical protein
VVSQIHKSRRVLDVEMGYIRRSPRTKVHVRLVWVHVTERARYADLNFPFPTDEPKTIRQALKSP